MTVGYGNADALRSDRDIICVDDLVAFDMTPELQGLLLALLFLTADVRDNVIYHFGPTLKGLARAGDRLIGTGKDFIDLELLFDRMDRGYIAL